MPSISLRGQSRSLILVPIESAYTYSYQWSIATWTLSCTFQRYGGLNVENRQFSLPHSIPAKIWGVPFGLDPSCSGLQSGYYVVRLISCEIIFAEFQPIYHDISTSQTDGQRDRQTHGRTDGRTTCLGNTALR